MIKRVREYHYHAMWSAEDNEYVGCCVEFPSLSHLDPSKQKALAGIKALVKGVLVDMRAGGEKPPWPIEGMTMLEALARTSYKRGVGARPVHWRQLEPTCAFVMYQGVLALSVLGTLRNARDERPVRYTKGILFSDWELVTEQQLNDAQEYRNEELRRKFHEPACDPPNACATHGRCWTHSTEDPTT